MCGSRRVVHRAPPAYAPARRRTAEICTMRFVLDLQRAVLTSELPSTARHLMLSLAVKADWETGVIPHEHSPSLTTLAAMTGLTRSTVAEWLDSLETGGWVKRERPPKGSRSIRTRYTLLVGSSLIAKPARASRRNTAGDTNGPAGGPLDEVDARTIPSREGPPSGPAAVRQADPCSPPSGPASTEISPSERSTSQGRPVRAKARPVTPGRSGNAGTRIPADFHATTEMITWARQHTPNVGRSATDAFIDYFTAAPDPQGRREDWSASWRNWMRREQITIERRPGFQGAAIQTAVDAAPTTTTTQSELAAPCRAHRGNRAGFCGPCRAERLAEIGLTALLAEEHELRVVDA
jgi:hypothetical protein